MKVADNMIKKRLSILLMLLIVLCTVGCNKPNTADNSDAVPAYADFEPLTEIKEGRTDIYLIVKLIDSGYWQVILKVTGTLLKENLQNAAFLSL